MKQWMLNNWAKVFVRVVFVVVAGAFFIPRMAARLEAHVQSQQTARVATFSDSLILKAAVEEWDPKVVDSCGMKTIMINAFTAVSENGDTVTQCSADSVFWVLDYHTQPFKVVLLQRTQQSGESCLIAVLHIPYDIYEVVMR